ncbi:MAG: SDR family NAD(P)-dependent oxidoreductase, partial [Rhodospirillaceae bacterium]|nr:SDR family NAD(P)-dependent oxidoreductase [Rhodospirillaceae bacterium]
MSNGIDAQRVIVTAGGSGIGRAIVDRFVAGGARVHTCDVQQELLDGVIASDDRISGSLADVGEPKDVEEMVAAAVEVMGGIDVLVNNAGIGGPRAALEDISYADWDRTIGVNLNGMFYCIKNVA